MQQFAEVRYYATVMFLLCSYIPNKYD